MSDQVAAELDLVQEQAKRAYAAKDVSAFMGLFAPQLEYTQADGRTIDHAQLTRDVQSQMSRLRAMDTNYERKCLTVDGDRATEEVIQDAWAEMAVFFIFKRRWRIRRTGRYHWLRTPEGWRILKVRILDEQVR